MSKIPIRQGDVGLMPVNAIPNEAAPFTDRVLVRGQHHHRLAGTDGKVFQANSILYLDFDQPVDMVHEEHATVTIPAGKYAVVRPEEVRDGNPTQIED